LHTIFGALLFRTFTHDNDTLQQLAHSSRTIVSANHQASLSLLLEQAALTSFKRFMDTRNRYGRIFFCVCNLLSCRSLESASTWLFSTTPHRVPLAMAQQNYLRLPLPLARMRVPKMVKNGLNSYFRIWEPF
jgi:hypothetical protein